MQQPGQVTDERQHQSLHQSDDAAREDEHRDNGRPVRELAPEGWGRGEDTLVTCGFTTCRSRRERMEDPSARETAEAARAPTGPVVMEWCSHHRSGRRR